MKYLLIFLSLIAAVCAESIEITTQYQKAVLESTVVRTRLYTSRYCYDLYSSEGVFLAQGISRAFSCGLFCTRLMEFDVYDEMGGYVGYIGGECCTDELAKFVFMNVDGNEVGSVILRSDSKKVSFLILSPTNAIVATLDALLSENFSGWEFHVKQSVGIDARMLKIFSAFVSDFHSAFSSF